MKLQRLKVEQLRQFRQPFELDGLVPGLNLFCGPNEAGKSTLVRAIRAAFFERHRSTSVDDLLPWGDSAAAPTVELDFETGGRAYRLHKRFLNKRRCELQAGTQRFDGEDAEQQLAELLGFEFSSRGASKAEHWGIPGLLWIEQGGGQEIDKAVGHAGAHLRRALDQSVGEIASSQGDDVLARVREQREALLTQAGKPRAAYADALAELETQRARLALFDQRIEQYRQQVDQLGSLQAQDAADERERPWDGFRQQQQQAQARLAETDAIRGLLEADRAALAQVREKLKLVEQQLASFDAQQRELAQREAALAGAEEELARQRAASSARRGASDGAEAAYAEANATLTLARQEDLRAQLHQRLADAGARAGALAGTLAQAEAEQLNLRQLRELVRAHALDKRELARLRALRAAIDELRIRQQVAATRLSFDLQDGARVTLDGQALTARGERALTGAARMQVEGIGTFQIAPGGTDLAELARSEREQDAELQALLQALGVASCEQAEQRHLRHQELLLEAAQAEKTCTRLMPDGIEALRAALADADAARQAAQDRLEQLPAPSDAIALTLAEAQQRQGVAHEQLAALSRATHEAQVQLATVEARRDGAARERDVLAALLAGAERQQRKDEAGRNLVNSRAEAETLAARVLARERELEASRPDILAQDVERWRRSADQAELAFRERRVALGALRARLEEAGAQGLDEARAEAFVRTEAAARRVDELRTRAQALDLLLRLFEEKRQALTRRLRAPLQKHLDRYLQLLFPHASLDLGDDLAPAMLTRMGPDGSVSGHFDSMSFGAREQMGVISRLAYADLLKQAGRPTLIILDDALVHSDALRLEQMKRVLFDAAGRHQVLLFTCHPAAWQGLGVAPRPIALA